MNKKLKVIIGIIITMVVLWLIFFLVDYVRVLNFKEPIFVIKGEILMDGGSYKGYGLGYRVEVEKRDTVEYGTCLEKVEMYMLNKFIAGNVSNINEAEQEIQTNEKQNNVVIIKNDKIENENLIDTYLESSKTDGMELNIIDEDKNICIKYIAPTEPQSGENGYDIGDGSMETRKKIFGYYIYSVDGEIKGEFTNIDHKIARGIGNGKVTLYFNAEAIDYIQIPTICDYDLDSSNYIEKFKLTYRQRKDLGINEIFNYGEYKVKTFGGNVSITIDGDMVYELEDALNQKIITPDDIINQAKLDFKYGVCQEDYYSDGGSIEYKYWGKETRTNSIYNLKT